MAVPHDVREFVKGRNLTEADTLDTNVRTGVTLGLYLACLSLASLTGHQAAWVVFWIVGSVLLCGAFAAVHEAIHGSLYKNRWANDAAGMVWGLAVLNPYATYRSWHYQHHVYTRTENDTEPAFVVKSRAQVFGTAAFAMVGLNIALWIEMFFGVVGRHSEYVKRTASRTLVWLNLGVFALFFVLLSAGLDSWRQAAAVWLIPALGGSVLSGFAVGHEHLSCVPDTSDAFLHSRTVKSNRVARYFLWNANYHTGHHLVPTVTGRNLALLQQQINDRCHFRAGSFSSFYGEIARNPQDFETRAQELGREAAASVLSHSDAAYGERAGHRG